MDMQSNFDIDSVEMKASDAVIWELELYPTQTWAQSIIVVQPAID